MDLSQDDLGYILFILDVEERDIPLFLSTVPKTGRMYVVTQMNGGYPVVDPIEEVDEFLEIGNLHIGDNKHIRVVCSGQ